MARTPRKESPSDSGARIIAQPDWIFGRSEASEPLALWVRILVGDTDGVLELYVRLFQAPSSQDAQAVLLELGAADKPWHVLAILLLLLPGAVEGDVLRVTDDNDEQALGRLVRRGNLSLGDPVARRALHHLMKREDGDDIVRAIMTTAVFEAVKRVDEAQRMRRGVDFLRWPDGTMMEIEPAKLPLDTSSEWSFGWWLTKEVRNAAEANLRGRYYPDSCSDHREADYVEQVPAPGGNEASVRAPWADGVPTDPEELAILSEVSPNSQSLLGRLLQAASPRQQSIWRLRAEGLTHSEIGARLGIAEGTVKCEWFRLKKKAQNSPPDV